LQFLHFLFYYRFSSRHTTAHLLVSIHCATFMGIRRRLTMRSDAIDKRLWSKIWLSRDLQLEGRQSYQILND